MNAGSKEPSLHCFCYFSVTNIKSYEGSVSSYIVDLSIFNYSVEFYFDEGGSILNQVQEIFLLNLFPDYAVAEELDQVDGLFEVVVQSLLGERKGGVVTGNASFATECHQVWCILEIPVIMAPKFSGGPDTSLCLINYKWNIVFQSNKSKLFVEIWSSHSIINSRNRFNNYRSYIPTTSFPISDCIPHLIQTPIFFSLILLFMINQRKLHLWKLSCWPIKKRHTLHICCPIRCTKGTN